MFNFHTHTPGINSICNIDSIDSIDILENAYYSLGNHPWHKEISIQTISNITTINPEIIAIGECGIDTVKNEYPIQKQIEVLKKQIHLSEELKIPVILHIVRGYNEIISLKREFNPKQKWIIHGFNKYALASSLLRDGFYLSFGNNLLINTKLQLSFIDTPLDKIFLETDSSVEKIENLYKFAAQLKGIDIFVLKNHIRQNLSNITNGKLVRTI